MGKGVTLAVANQKGGVGKTSTALAVASGLSRRGHKVLAIDADQQANFSYAAGAFTGVTILDVLTKQASAKQAIVKLPYFDAICADSSLAGAEIKIDGQSPAFRLRDWLEKVRGDYDFVVMDCPPQLGIITVNCLTAANWAIVPCFADAFAMQGLAGLFKTIGMVQKRNTSLRILGILLTRFNPRSTLSKDLGSATSKIAGKYGTRVFDTKIREGVALRECQLLKKCIFDYAPRSGVAKDYAALIDEILKGVENG